jgi:GTP-binding protein LepA
MFKNIRNFTIISHIDHGKSTLADRFLELTGTVEARQMKPQYLDQLELERERGITIKMAPVRMIYHPLSNSEYILNLIDTPGHSDFSYEVSRALAAVEGAILLVDATQGVQAQTLANLEAARKSGLKIIGSVNKIDVASQEQIENSLNELAHLLSVKTDEVLRVSGKTGEGVPLLLQAVIDKVPAPKAIEPRAALIFSSVYDDHKGVIAFVRVFGGEFKAGDDSRLLGNNKEFKIKEVGFFRPELHKEDILGVGDIGYIATGIKDPDSVQVGDTIGEKILSGFKKSQPVVFVSLYPENNDDHDNLKISLYKLRLNDSSFSITPITSEALGRGFQGGFLGRLHFEIVVQRLEREFNVKVINSFPSVSYKVKLTNGDWVAVENPKDFPDDYSKVLEPIAAVTIIAPFKNLGDVLKLKESFRFSKVSTDVKADKVIISTLIPLADIISDFDDRLRSVSSGFASFSYEIIDYKEAKVKRLDIKIAGSLVHGLSRIIPESDVERTARHMAEKLKEILPRKQFIQAIQAISGGRVIARETIPALKKDVTGYLYGGDRTRKMKLWQKQKRGKKKLLQMASEIRLPVKIFKDLLR